MQEKLIMKVLNQETFEIEKIGEKLIYSVPAEIRTTNWCRTELVNIPKIECPNLTNYKNISEKNTTKISINALAHMIYDTNDVYHNTEGVLILALPFSSARGSFSIINENFLKSVACFCARKIIFPNWTNCSDQYMKPADEILNSDIYKQWNFDTIVYSLFNSHSQQSSLRQIDYKKQKWNIFNHFFFMSNKEMLELANKYKFTEMYEDARKFNEDRYVYKLLEQVNLSTDAKQVLEYAREMIRKSIELRRIWHEENPEYHLDAWDAGYAQHREVWKKHFKKEFDVFRELYKSFEDRMREGVYKFGFLK